MPDYSNTLGDAVRRARMKLDLTQSEVAESIGCAHRFEH